MFNISSFNTILLALKLNFFIIYMHLKTAHKQELLINHFSIAYFQLISWVLIAIGIWAYFATQQYNSGTSDTKSLFDIFFDISLLFIIFGSVIFLLAFLGAIGSLRENTCLLKTVSSVSSFYNIQCIFKSCSWHI